MVGQEEEGEKQQILTLMTSSSSFWSRADKSAHNASLGCHIASIARYFRLPTENHTKKKSGVNNSNKRSSNTLPVISALHVSSLACKEEMYQCAMQQHPWLLGIEHFDPSEYDPTDLLNFPELAMNDGVLDDDDYFDDGDRTMTLTLINITPDSIKIYIVSVFDADLCGAAGNVLKSGVASSKTTTADDSVGVDDTKERKCTTFIVVCPPQTYVHLCSLAPNQQILASSSSTSDHENYVPLTSWSQVAMEMYTQTCSYHPNTDDEHPYLMHFPFAPHHDNTDSTAYALNVMSSTTAYKCIQSEYGQFLHFSRANYHTIDFACPVGTPLYSPVNGKVFEIRDAERRNASVSEHGDTNVVEVSGIAARNMFYCNSIMVQAMDDDDHDDAVTGQVTKVIQQQQHPKQEDQLYVEFTHIEINSCVVQVGDVVKKGQLLCMSGSVGFCPEPHLHFAAYPTNNEGQDLATVRVRFECERRREDINIDDDAKVQSSSSPNNDEKGWKWKQQQEEDEEIVATSFLPRAGGWYNRWGLVLQNDMR